MNDHAHRLVRKTYQCFKCNQPESQLVNPESYLVKCSKCNGVLNEVSESDYKYMKNIAKDSNNAHNQFHSNMRNNQPMKPSREYYDRYNLRGQREENDQFITLEQQRKNQMYSPMNQSCTKGKTKNKRGNVNKRKEISREQHEHNMPNYHPSINTNISYDNHMTNHPRKKKRFQSIDIINNQSNRIEYPTNESSSNHITNNDASVYDNRYNQRYNNVPGSNDTNGFASSIYRSFFNEDTLARRECEYQQRHAERAQNLRHRSIQPNLRRQHNNNPLGLIFIQNPDFMIMPMIPIQMMIPQIRPQRRPMMFQSDMDLIQNNSINNNDHIQFQQMMTPVMPIPFHISVQNHDFNEEDVWDPEFLSFGSTLNGFFRDNFAQNYRSNLEDIMFERFRQMINANLAQPEVKKKKTKKDALNKLKKFAMSDNYCKKKKNGKNELPNCCICLSDIQMKEQTLLLPCGHMFHTKCSMSWLQDNNTCPVCRFELPYEEEDDLDDMNI